MSKVCCATGLSVESKTQASSGGLILAEAKLEFKQAFELAKAMESADRDATTLINNSSTAAHTIPG